ncbi:MAG: hypothetical protein QOE92_2252 [Chloroflexota bacterium]|nr:hypothetical protein [Chloroflexota bacterium]
MVLVIGCCVLVYANRSRQLVLYGNIWETTLLVMLFPTVGALIARTLPRNAVGWIFIASGICLILNNFLPLYAVRGALVAPGTLPGVEVAAWAGSWIWIPGVELLIAFMPLLFPNGRANGRLWGWFVRLAVAVLVLQIVVAAIASIPSPGARIDGSGTFELASGGLGPAIFSLATIPGVLLAVGAVISLVQRLRGSTGPARQQMKWFAFAGAVATAGFATSTVTTAIDGTSGPLYDLGATIFVTSAVAIPVAAGIAILRYRLYDIDVVINRAVVYGALAVIISLVYVGVVAGVGALVHGSDSSNLVLSLGATAIVALAFQPARARLQRLANRLVYGQRADPYAVLSGFSQSMAETYAGEDVLDRMARLLAQGTTAVAAEVWLRVGDDLRPAAAWPRPASDAVAVPVDGDRLPSLSGRPITIAVRQQGELLGALTVSKKAGDELAPMEQKLLDDLALQAGLLLRNAGLTEELKQRLEELRASRQRLVAAQDAASRRIERNLHDGAQQHIVALKIKLGLLEGLVGKDPEKAHQLAGELKDDADATLQELRDLARGIYPPLLADRGLSAALEAQAGKASLPVTVEVDGTGRYPQDIEAAVYFCCLEALQNTAKYGAADHATIAIAEVDGSLRFKVMDDGRGFDSATVPMGSGLQNMADRLDALGGEIVVVSAPGQGTEVRGSIPVRVEEPGSSPAAAGEGA